MEFDLVEFICHGFFGGLFICAFVGKVFLIDFRDVIFTSKDGWSEVFVCIDDDKFLVRA